jgi:hypothetical protein
MAVLPTLAKVLRGQAIPLATSVVGDQCQCGPGLFLICQNTSAGALTVTLAVPGNDDLSAVAKPDNVESVAAGEVRMIPLDARYSDSSINGLCALTYQTPGATFKVAVVSAI